MTDPRSCTVLNISVDGISERVSYILFPLYCTGGALAESVTGILSETRLVTAISRCSHEDTSELESYHSFVNRNAPKHTPSPIKECSQGLC